MATKLAIKELVCQKTHFFVYAALQKIRLLCGAHAIMLRKKHFMFSEIVNTWIAYSKYLPSLGLLELVTTPVIDTILEGSAPDNTQMAHAQNPASSHTCVICHEQANNNPLNCQVNHLFHRVCFANWLLNHQTSGEPKCPQCHTKLNISYFQMLNTHLITPAQLATRISQKALLIFFHYPLKFFILTRNFMFFPTEALSDKLHIVNRLSRAILTSLAIYLISTFISFDLWSIIFLGEILSVPCGIVYGLIMEGPDLCKIIYGIAYYTLSNIAQTFLQAETAH